MATAFPAGAQAIPRNPNEVMKHREMMGYRYYDSMIVDASDAINSYQFFKDVQGKDTFRTNMNVGGYLPADEVFEVKAIAMTFAPPELNWGAMTTTNTTFSGAVATGWAASANVFKMGYWEMHIGDKSYNKGPLHEIIATESEFVYLGPVAAFDMMEHQDTPFFKQSGLYPLEVPVTLEKGIPFYVDVHWNAAIGLAAGATAYHLYIYCHLFGRRERRAIG